MDEVEIKRATMLRNSFGCQTIVEFVEFALRHLDHIERAVLHRPTLDEFLLNSIKVANSTIH
jgi:hypothetical protein